MERSAISEPIHRRVDRSEGYDCLMAMSALAWTITLAMSLEKLSPIRHVRPCNGCTALVLGFGCRRQQHDPFGEADLETASHSPFSFSGFDAFLVVRLCRFHERVSPQHGTGH